LSSPSKREDKINRIYLELNMLNSLAESLQKQSEVLNKYVADTQLSIETLNEISRIGEGHKVLLPLGSQLLIDATLNDTENAYLNVGAKIIVRKPISNIKEYLEKQLKQLQKEYMAAQKKLGEVMNRISLLQSQLNSLIQQKSG